MKKWLIDNNLIRNDCKTTAISFKAYRKKKKKINKMIIIITAIYRTK